MKASRSQFVTLENQGIDVSEYQNPVGFRKEAKS